MLNIQMEQVDGVLQVALEGRLNNVTTNELAKAMESGLQGARAVEFDFAKLEFISSSGLRVLKSTQRYMNEVGGEIVRVKNASGTVLETLEMTGFWGLFSINE